MHDWQTLANGSEFLGVPAAAVPGVIQEVYAINYNVVAGSMLLFYDMLLTLDQEVQYIWKPKLSLIGALFEVVRLLAVGGQIAFLVFNIGIMTVAESYCRSVVWFQGMLGLIMFLFVDILLIYRLYAIYGRNKALLISLCAMEFISFTAVIILFSIALPKFQTAPNPFPHQVRVGVCVPLGYPKLEPDIWTPILPVQSILFLLAVGRYIYIQWRNSKLFNNPLRSSHIYHTFIRDGTWVFFVLLAVILMCVIGNNLHFVVGPIAIQWCYPVIGICVSRLILNLRSVIEQPQASLPQTGAVINIRVRKADDSTFESSGSDTALYKESCESP